MPSVIQLSELDKFGSFLYIIGAFLEITAADKTEEAALNRQGNNASSSASKGREGPTPVELVAAASILFLSGNLTFFNNSIARLNQAQQDVQSGRSNASLTPPILITAGWLISVIGSTLRAIGHQLDLKEATSSPSQY